MPVGLRDLWVGVDLILHAGDVGELDVLDLLGGFAPNIAVHGNDEPERTDLISVIAALGKIAYEDGRAVVRAVVPLYRRCLSDGRMRREDLLEAISSSDLITSNDKKSILEAIIRCQ